MAPTEVQGRSSRKSDLRDKVQYSVDRPDGPRQSWVQSWPLKEGEPFPVRGRRLHPSPFRKRSPRCLADSSALMCVVVGTITFHHCALLCITRGAVGRKAQSVKEMCIDTGLTPQKIARRMNIIQHLAPSGNLLEVVHMRVRSAVYSLEALIFA